MITLYLSRIPNEAGMLAPPPIFFCSYAPGHALSLKFFVGQKRQGVPNLNFSCIILFFTIVCEDSTSIENHSRFTYQITIYHLEPNPNQTVNTTLPKHTANMAHYQQTGVDPEKSTATLIFHYKQECNHNNLTPVTLYNIPIPYNNKIKPTTSD